MVSQNIGTPADTLMQVERSIKSLRWSVGEESLQELVEHLGLLKVDSMTSILNDYQSRISLQMPTKFPLYLGTIYMGEKTDH